MVDVHFYVFQMDAVEELVHVQMVKSLTSVMTLKVQREAMDYHHIEITR